MNACPLHECQTTAGCAHRGPRGEFCYGFKIVREGTLLERVERLERIVEALNARQPPIFPEWQPIETALKDGTPVLLAGGEDYNAIFARDEDAARMRSPCRGWWDGNDWIITLAEAAHIAAVRNNPTHWMPIPAFP